MPKRLRPKVTPAAEAVLVGDPGRSLLLAQELLEEPKMSNHARGLWGYSGTTLCGGRKLTIQATGMGGPSAALVLADLAKLGLKSAVRIGTCTGFVGRAELGEMLLVSEAVAAGGSAASFGLTVGETVGPDAALFERLRDRLADGARPAVVESLDTLPVDPGEPASGIAAADMQTAAILARARQLGIAVAAVLIVSEVASEALADEILGDTSTRAGRAAVDALSNPQVEG